MMAAYIGAHGEVDAVQFTNDWPIPNPGRNEVRVAIKATSLNYHDVFTCRGMPGIQIPLPIIIGIDAAGVVDAIGDDVSDVKIGDRVVINPLDPANPQRGLMGEMYNGGAAEYCVVAEGQVVPLPDNVSFADAAALPVAYGTAHRMLFAHGKLSKEDRVLILGASGGVGSCCVLLAKMIGAEVIACASSESKLETLRNLGADHVINYRKNPEFYRNIWEMFGKPHRRTDSGGVTCVVNFTGGDSWVPSLKCLRRGGRVLTCGATAGFAPQEDLRYIWSYELEIKGSNSWRQSDIVSLVELVATGQLAPLIDRVLPLDQIVDGLRLLTKREAVGKVVLEPF